MAAVVTEDAAAMVAAQVVSKYFRWVRRLEFFFIPCVFSLDLFLMLWRLNPLNATWYLASENSHFDYFGVAGAIWGPFVLFWVTIFIVVFCLSHFFKISQVLVAIPLLLFSTLNALVLTPALLGSLILEPGVLREVFVYVLKGGPPLVISFLVLWTLGLLFHSKKNFFGRQRILRFGGTIFIFLFLFFVAIPPVYLENLFVPEIPDLQKPMTLLVGVDALNADSYVNEDWILEKSHPYLEYERTKLKPRRVYTPIAKTQLTYVSLLTGKSPEDAGLDTIFASQLQSFKETLQDSMALRLAAHRQLNILYLGSDQEYAYFPKVGSYFLSKGASPGVQNILGPILLRSPFFFGLLNNWLGLFLFPEIVGNSSYSDTYWPVFFVKQVVDNLHDNKSGKENLILSHLVKAHWPGSLQWPYYFKSEQYLSGYDLLTAKNYLPPIRRGPDLSRNRVVYDQLKKQILYEYLDPLFKRVLAHQDRNLKVFVLSDHGEDFFSDGPLPLSKTPRHGTSVLFEKNSNALYFRSPLDFSEDHFAIQDLLKAVYQFDKTHFPKKIVEMASDRWIHRSHSFQLFGGRCPACTISFAGRVPIVNKEGEELIRVTRERKWIVNDKVISLIPNDFGYFLGTEEDHLPVVLTAPFKKLKALNYVPHAYRVKAWKGYFYLDDSENLARLDRTEKWTHADVFQYVIATKAQLYRNLDLKKYLERLKKLSTLKRGYMEPILGTMLLEVCPFLGGGPAEIKNKWANLIELQCNEWSKKRPYLGDAYAYLESPAGEILKEKIFKLMARDPSQIFSEVQKFERSWFADVPIPFLGAPLHAFVLSQLSQRGLHRDADMYARELIGNYPLCWPLLRILSITQTGKRLFFEQKFIAQVSSAALTRDRLLALYK
ncbi:MAG: hypothetical protein HUU57_07115 [Bdellovibrio sp.]|nr:hypothetical protein [Bdellovibrio sp.]